MSRAGVVRRGAWAVAIAAMAGCGATARRAPDAVSSSAYREAFADCLSSDAESHGRASLEHSGPRHDLPDADQVTVTSVTRWNRRLHVECDYGQKIARCAQVATDKAQRRP